jgi:hypothetical protein
MNMNGNIFIALLHSCESDSAVHCCSRTPWQLYENASLIAL